MSGLIFLSLSLLVLLAVVVWASRRRPHEEFTVHLLSERKEAGMDILKFRVGIPTTEDSDVVGRQLVVQRDVAPAGILEPEETIDLDDTQDSIDIEAVQDSNVSLSLTAVDDSGNHSAPLTFQFQALDTIPPEIQGSFTVTAVEERSVEDPAE